MKQQQQGEDMVTDVNQPRSAGIRFLVTGAAFVIVVAGMREAASMIVPFLLATFIAIICSPPLFWLKRKGVPALLAIVLVITSLLAVGFFLAVFVGTSLHDFSQSLPAYQERLSAETSTLLAWLRKMGVDISDATLAEYFDPGAAMKFASGMISGLGSMLSNGFLILLTVVFIFFEASSFPGKLRAALGDPGASLASFDTFITNVNQYMAIKTWISFATGIFIALWLVVLGVDYPFLWGLLAFLLNYVPNIGSIIAAVPAVLLAWIQLGDGTALFTALGYLLVNVIGGSIIEPRYMGRGLGLSTLVVFVSLVFWGWVLGPVGMVLSVPLTMMVKIALDSREDTRWAAILLGPEVSVAERK
jgi:predicted PurR-regulated permease PerM